LRFFGYSNRSQRKRRNSLHQTIKRINQVKVVIMAGGKGLRLREVTNNTPKALAKVGGLPLVSHIIQHYRSCGFHEFIVLTGYLGEQIQSYFNDCTLDRRIDVVDTGLHTSNGGRLRRIAHLLEKDSPFLMTWTDGFCDVDLNRLLAFHNDHGKLATLTAVNPPSRFGHLTISGDKVTKFEEKPLLDDQWINGGYFVLQPEVLRLLRDDDTEFEHDVLSHLAQNNQLSAFKHKGYWQCVDTINDLELLNQHWKEELLPLQQGANA